MMPSIQGSRPCLQVSRVPEGLSEVEQLCIRPHNEHRVELCLEERRFLRLASLEREQRTLRAPIKGMTVEFDGNNNNYKIVTIEERVFNENNYYLPIPHSETEKNPNVLERN